MRRRWIAIVGLVVCSRCYTQDGALQQAAASMSAQHYDDAMDRFESVLITDPKNQVARAGEVDAASQAALALRAKGEMDKALAQLVRAAKVVPNDPTLLFDLGVLENQMHLNHDADEALQKSIALHPGDAMTLYAIARVKMDLQLLPEADEAMRAYLQLKPNDPGAHYGLGRILQMGLKSDEAVAEFNKSIALKPEQSESYFELGEIALQAGETDTAQSNYRHCLARAPHHAGALTGMGILEFRKKRYATAADYLKLAVQADSQFQTAHYYYGLTLAKLERKDESESELAQAAKLAAAQSEHTHQRLAPNSQ
jgi:tetratricopeptide (TPR) repeat protein